MPWVFSKNGVNPKEEYAKLTTQSSTSVKTARTIEDKINKWIDEELPWKVETSRSEIAEKYNNEKLSGESLEEFLNRLSCLGKL
jgi:alanyl-tRNA synthetase